MEVIDKGSIIPMRSAVLPSCANLILPATGITFKLHSGINFLSIIETFAPVSSKVLYNGVRGESSMLLCT